MANKFGKFLLATAAIGTAAAAAYYYFQKKDADLAATVDSDEDYDDFSDDLDEEAATSRSYVSLNSEDVSDDTDTDDTKASPLEAVASEIESTIEDTFTPLAEQVSQATENFVENAEAKIEETVEDFFDEEDATEEEPPIQDNEYM